MENFSGREQQREKKYRKQQNENKINSKRFEMSYNSSSFFIASNWMPVSMLKNKNYWCISKNVDGNYAVVAM